MLFCLTYLTNLNHFMYSDAAVYSMDEQKPHEEPASEIPPSGIPEEKSGGTPFSFSEEILHESHPDFSFLLAGLLTSFSGSGSDYFPLFHPELTLPPPKA